MSSYQGTFIVTFADTGPKILYNSSIYNFERVLNLGVQGLTALQLGEDETLYGPLPTHQADVIGIVFNLKVAVHESTDERIRLFGRPTNIWMLLKRTELKAIFHNWEAIEKRLRNILNEISIRYDDDFTDEKLAEMDRQMRTLFEPILEEQGPPEQANLNVTPKGNVEYLLGAVRLGDLVIDHDYMICYLFTSVDRLRELLDRRGSLDEELYGIQEFTRGRHGKWYAIRVITDPKDQERIKAKYSRYIHD